MGHHNKDTTNKVTKQAKKNIYFFFFQYSSLIFVLRKRDNTMKTTRTQNTDKKAVIIGTAIFLTIVALSITLALTLNIEL